jgi:hypothetical protein
MQASPEDSRPTRRGSLPLRSAIRRDSLFSASGSCSGDEDDDRMVVAFSAAHLYAPTQPRRRFARRNAFCQFQLLHDAVQTSMDTKGGDIMSNSIHVPPTVNDNGADATDFSSSQRRRKELLDLPLITESETLFSLRTCESAAMAVSENQPRKISRTSYRTSPSIDAMYSDEATR